jgi:hypothetical protein
MESGRARYPDEEQMPEPPPLAPAMAPQEAVHDGMPVQEQAQLQPPPMPLEAVSAPPPQPASAPPAEASGQGNVEQIRDILFGVQMRDYERRFSNLEARLTQEAAMLRDDIRARFDALEVQMRQQFNALSESLGNERDNRTGAVNKVNDDVRVLRDDAADRRALAAMFTEIARRLEGGNGSAPPNGSAAPADTQ